MRTLTVKNFERFQHYKDRSPPWIKLYYELLTDYAFLALAPATQRDLLMIWLLASRHDGVLPYDERYIRQGIRARRRVDLASLIDAGFLVPVEQDASVPLAERWQHASEVLADRRQSASPRARPRARGETERETEAEAETEQASVGHPRAHARAREAFLAQVPPEKRPSWKAEIETAWPQGQGLPGGIAASATAIETGLSDYLREVPAEQRSFSPPHVRAFVARAARAEARSPPRSGNSGRSRAPVPIGAIGYENARVAAGLPPSSKDPEP